MFETMSMALLGCHAVPMRIKILLDRIWSASRLQVDLTQFLMSFGWTLQDYTRGYMLMVRNHPYYFALSRMHFMESVDFAP